MSKGLQNVVLQPLESPDFVALLLSFHNLFKSSLGPHGKLKIIITGGGCSILTSSSTRLLNNIIIDNPICLFISQIMKSQLTDFKDSGLYTGVLMSNFLAQILTEQILPYKKVSFFIQQITSDLIAVIDSIKIHVDFSTVKQVLPFVKSILNSKSACCMSSIEVDRLTVTIVKAFLNSLNDDIGDVNVVCGECCGLDTTNLVQGCLYQTNEDIYKPSLNICATSQKKLVIVFNAMLSYEKPKKQKLVDMQRVSLDLGVSELFQMEKAVKVLEIAVSLGISIVACQKVVHPWLKLYLQRKGVLLLDRMGTEVTRRVVDISGAEPISDLARCEQESLEPFLGYVNCIRPVVWGGKTYIALERADKNVCTLLVRAANPEAAEELKITIEQALHSLRHLLMEPFVTPGAGCLEMVLAANLHYSILQKQDVEKYPLPLSQLQTCVHWLQISLLSASCLYSTLSNLAVDSAYYHAWNFGNDNDWTTCRCGLVTAAMVHTRHKGWKELNISSRVLFSECEDPEYVTASEINENVILDLYSSKYNALKLSLEGCIGLLAIGMVVSKAPL